MESQRQELAETKQSMISDEKNCIQQQDGETFFFFL